MAQVDFGAKSKWQMAQDMYGKDHTEAPDAWLKWAHKKLQDGADFAMSDQGRRLTPAQQLAAIQGEIDKRAGNVPQQQQQPVAQTPQISQAPRQQRPAQGIGDWFLATAKVDAELPDQNGVDHKIHKGQDVALKNNGDGTWVYATLYRGGIQWYHSQMPEGELKGIFQRQTDDAGNPIKGASASALAKSTHVEEKKEFTPTEEQQDIADTFARNMENDINNHMVINAGAGTGKTTTLKQLAKKYSRGQKWLYLVFNKKNEEEASREFPKDVKVKTANSFGGEVIRDNKKSIPHGQKLITQIGGRGSSARLEQLTRNPSKDRYGDWQSTAYEDEVLSSLNMNAPLYELDSKVARNYAKKVKKIFNEEVMNIVGKAKSYGIFPGGSNDPDQMSIEDIMQLHLFDSEIDKVKESISEMAKEDPDGAAEVVEELNEYYQVNDFMTYDFEERMVEAAKWLLEKSAPGTHDEQFQQPSYDKKELLAIFKKGDQWLPGVDGWFKKKVQDMEYNQRNPRNNTRMPSWQVRKQFENAGVDPTMHSTKDFRDFDDDVWFLTIADQLNWPKFDVVLVDEVQDFNRVQKTMLNNLIDQGAKVVAVGDPQQGIYRFRGSDHKAFGDVSQMLMDRSEEPEQVQKTLSHNWRSKPGIIDRANQRSLSRNLTGQLTAGVEDDPLAPARTSDFEQKVKKAIEHLGQEYQSLGELRKETAFISRNNQPLISAATELIKRGIPFQVQGINLGTEIKKLIDDVQTIGNLEDDAPFSNFESKFNDYQEHKIEEFQKADTNVKEDVKEFKINVEAITNSMETYKAAEDTDNKSVKDFKVWMAKRLGGGKEGVTLTTAHKSKGLEFDRVFDIAPSLYGASPKLKKAEAKMEAAEADLEAFEAAHPNEDELSPDELETLNWLRKRAKNYRLRYEGDAQQEWHAEYVVGTRGREEHHELDDTPDDDDDDDQL